MTKQLLSETTPFPVVELFVLSETAPFPVIEIFGPTIQGEGPAVGRVCSFVRFAFCDFNCAWCDTKFSWESPEFTAMNEHDIVAKLRSQYGGLDPVVVVLTGGNPALQKHVDLIMNLLPETDFHVETQGTIWQEWLNRCTLVISPKVGLQDPDDLEDFLSNISYLNTSFVSIKVVIFDADKELLRALALLDAAYDMNIEELILQVGTLPGDTPEILGARTSAILKSLHRQRTPIRVLPQVHVLLWGHRRGV